MDWIIKSDQTLIARNVVQNKTCSYKECVCHLQRSRFSKELSTCRVNPTRTTREIHSIIKKIIILKNLIRIVVGQKHKEMNNKILEAKTNAVAY